MSATTTNSPTDDIFDYAYQFNNSGGKTLKPGLSPIQATAFAQREFPEVPSWTYYDVTLGPGQLLSRIAGKGYRTGDTIGDWRWERIPTSYPNMEYWTGAKYRLDASEHWVGAIRVWSPDNQNFIMFSYLSHRDEFSKQYLFSTHDRDLINSFIKAVRLAFRRRRVSSAAEINVINGPDISIPLKTKEMLLLPHDLLSDIETQVYSFFENKAMFTKLGDRYQRGFLFVGPPGTGKTMTIRHIVRNCHRKYRVNFYSILPKRNVDEDDLNRLFGIAQASPPAIILLDDMDSLTKESAVTRAGFLSALDGLSSNKGLLIIGTSNNAAHIDPALTQRPSRFDRVWTFPVPDATMRRKFLEHTFPGIDEDTITESVRRTGNWSYAYLNEIRTTARVLAIRAGQDTLTPEFIDESLQLLLKQFNAGRKGYANEGSENVTGFSAA